MAVETPVTFSTVLVSLASTALAHLGHPEGGEVPADARLARHTLEVLDLLAAKTQGNLDADEARLLAALQREIGAALAR